ncbi:hypothetical protein Cgig2_024011 [Carnegiea gigantea]|uniref:CCHC-type domain-containing protein n=1 Tax=Carnegiea gigantea TaxID=171969 RepID=A0A9Q1GHI7_9CARY|nr:hypothetical protein Cgig2_024011 [Carnegiea gigantea]
MLQDDASTHQRGKYVKEKDESATKTHLIRVKDPKVIIARGKPKEKKQRLCSHCHNIGHTQRTCPVNVNFNLVEKKLSLIWIQMKLMLIACNFTCKFQQNANTYGLNPTCDELMRHMPYIHTSGEISQVEYSEKVRKFDKHPTIVDWYLNIDW